MDPSQITNESVLDALKTLRAANALTDNPLVDLDIVTLKLRAEGFRDSEETRAWILSDLLDDQVWNNLCQLRNQSPDRAIRDALGPEDERALLISDFQQENLLLESWSLLFTRFLGKWQVTLARLDQELGVVRRTLERRTQRGITVLTSSLRSLELDAQRQLGELPAKPIADRIVIEPESGEQLQQTSEILDAVLNTVQDEERILKLSPEQAEAISETPITDIQTYRLTRIVDWSKPRYRLDERFVDLTLMLDRGDFGHGARWEQKRERFEKLRDVMRSIELPAFVLLGAPGSGKSTLLRRLELEMACEALRGEHDRVSYFVQLNHYSVPQGNRAITPYEWLCQRWSARYPKLPPLDELISEGRITLLLDALNEMPHSSREDYHQKLLAWKQCLHEIVNSHPDNQVLFSCRSLDYSAPLSTPALQVPQVNIEPLSDDQAHRFLHLYSPARCERIWSELVDTEQLDLLRSPYFLLLLIRYVESENRIPLGRAGLFTGFVRQALHREIQRDNPLFGPNALLSERDRRFVTQAAAQGSEFALPEQGSLFPGLAQLAFEMQSRAEAGQDAQIRIDYEDALAILDQPNSEDLLSAGLALAVLDEPHTTTSLTFFHQLLQEYFAGRSFAKTPQLNLSQVEWRAAEIKPSIPELLESLPASEPLPSLPSSGWEETVALAACMVDEPNKFILDLAEFNLPLAGRCAAQPEVRGRLATDAVGKLQKMLVKRSRDPKADLRARIEAALALGHLGDPRYELRVGEYGPYLLPPMVTISAGEYPIGTDDPEFPDCGPERRVYLESFQLGKFQVTNAEWTHFIRAGGYEDERWWDTPEALAWQRGEGTADGDRATFRKVRKQFSESVSQLHETREEGLIPQNAYEDWLTRLRMSDEEFEAHLLERWPSGTKHLPEYWSDVHFNNPTQPVVGICWHEARAYANWLRAQSGMPFRIPLETEWEAAARGFDGRWRTYGDRFRAAACNTASVHLQRTSPTGVFPEGDTPDGVSDLMGNVHEWTSHNLVSAEPNLSLADVASQVLRGFGWPDKDSDVLAFRRVMNHSTARTKDSGARLAIQNKA